MRGGRGRRRSAGCRLKIKGSKRACLLWNKRSRNFASGNQRPLHRGSHAAIVQNSRRGEASQVPSRRMKPQGRLAGALKRSKEQLIRKGCHRLFSGSREIRATPRNPASRVQPKNQRPDFLEALLQTPRAAGHPRPIGVQPNLQHQQRVVCGMSFLAVDALELAELELLQDATQQKTQTVLPQYVA
jgi:hypothetical protein